MKYAITERNVLTFCNHPFIVKLHAAFQTFDRLFLVLTYCPGGDLAKYLSKEKRFAESKAKLYAAEILLALEHLHKKDIIYRDLKPDNVVLDSEGHALLTDFGLSREGVYDQIVAKSFCGSVAYLAPEMLKKQGHGKAVDWYLLGVLIYEMIIGIPPFYSENRHEIFENIDKGSLKFPNYVSKESKSLLMKLLERDPAKRLGSGPMEANEIKDHPFFKDLSWDEIINRYYFNFIGFIIYFLFFYRKKSPGLPYLMKQYDKSHKFIDMELAFRDSEDSSKPKEDLQGWSFIEK